MSAAPSPPEDDDTTPGGPLTDAKPSAMVPLERQIGFALTAFGAGLAAVSVAAGSDPLAPLAGLVAAVGLGVAVWRAHRVFAMFAGLIVGFAVGFPVEVLFLGYSGFLMLRFNKAQAKRNASRPRPTPRQRQEAKAARAAARSGGTRAGTSAAPPGTRKPAPNSRYTPPKSKPKKPVPNTASDRGKKAAEAPTAPKPGKKR